MSAASVLLVARADALLIHAAAATVRVELSSGIDPRRIVDAASRGPSALAEDGIMSAAGAAQLSQSLAAQGIRLDGTDAADLPADVLPLRAVVATFVTSGKVPPGVVAVTATEALWLPPGLDPTLGERALRLFVARLPDPIRLGAYGRLIAGRRGLAIAGDLPDPQRANTIRAIALPVSGPRTWSWATSDPAETGSAIALPANGPRTWSWVAGDLAETGSLIGGAPLGRLAVAEVTLVDRWPLDDGSALHFARGAYASPQLATVDPFAPSPDPSHCAGADIEESPARARCLGEGLKRFALGDIPPGALHLAPAERLPGPWLNPAGVISYAAAHRERLGLDEFDPSRPEWWVTGHRPDGVPLWLPAALVYTPFPAAPAWLQPSYPSASAAAAHPDPDQAVLRAWLEDVAWDALQRARATERPCPGIDPRSLPTPLGPLVRRAQAVAQLRIVALSGGTGILVIAAAGFGEHSLALGLSAAADPVDAARKALVQACANLRFPSPAAPAPLAQLKWLLDGPLVNWRELNAPALPRVPGHVAVYRYPSRLLGGLTVAKVLDPQLIPITFGHDSDPTGCPAFAGPFLARGIDFTQPLPPHPFS
ncbi:hypothetical protein Rhe02_59900 [Rhizocola hellebori]|uniref:YcaO domain-containing protein n=1 Tax=Rhizocola hellebori TaxID=1392758 RepID=A0A8J3QBQ0_9ACTN|nr:YcaO-like family protein [Rhizocola hellebori]GIH07923.1 hypothetical protein Rhe02_59900 [Rhizocola hellebori]